MVIDLNRDAALVPIGGGHDDTEITPCDAGRPLSPVRRATAARIAAVVRLIASRGDERPGAACER